MVIYKPLWKYLAEILRGTRIYVSVNRLLRKRFFKENPLQAIAVDMLIHRLGLDYNRVYGRVVVSKKYNDTEYLFLCKRGDFESDIIYPGSMVTYIDLEKKIDYKPLFVVLNMFYHIHTISDRKRLGLQLGLMINVVRRWLWDKYLIFVDTPVELRNYITKYAGENRVEHVSLNKFCEILDQFKKPIALDPYSNKVISKRILKNVDMIIIGGIVDHDKPLRGATTKLIAMVEEICSKTVESYCVEINGFKTPVPHRLNRILEIIMKVLFENYSLKKAIISSMSNRDLAWYIGLFMREISSNEENIKELIQELENILGRKIGKEVLYRARRIAGL